MVLLVLLSSSGPDGIIPAPWLVDPLLAADQNLSESRLINWDYQELSSENLDQNQLDQNQSVSEPKQVSCSVCSSEQPKQELESFLHPTKPQNPTWGRVGLCYHGNLLTHLCPARRQYLDQEVALSADLVHKYSDVILEKLNWTIEELRRLFLVEDLVDSIKVRQNLWVRF